jgi:hypothetical protein
VTPLNGGTGNDQEQLRKIETRLLSHLDMKGGVNNAQVGMSRLVDSMKSETLGEGKLYELKVLAATTNKDCIQEFMSKGGIAILV